jgi:hypothetical protein
MSLPKTEGLYNPSLRFAFTNITAKEFTSKWDGAPINVPAGATVELPHHLAEKLTNELVDLIMQGLAVMDDRGTMSEKQGTSLGVPAMRQIWEDKIVRSLEMDEESPQLQILRSQIKAELEADLQDAQKAPASVTEINFNPTEFADLNNEVKEKSVKKPMKMKKL